MIMTIRADSATNVTTLPSRRNFVVLSTLVVLLSAIQHAWCFTPSPSSSSTTSMTQNSNYNRQQSRQRQAVEDDNDVDVDNTISSRSSIINGRRSFLKSISVAAGCAAYAASTAGVTNVQPSFASSDSALFRPNPLTNPLLEQIRILEQAEADNLKYGGELERGDAGNKGQVSAYPRLLMPILVYDDELRSIQRLVRQNTRESWTRALQVLQQPSYDKVTFKKTFNRYGDNIYYSDPDRANLYLGGGATPRTEQSLAYLLRNDVLTNVESLKAELEYLLKENLFDETDDLYQYADVAVGAMAKYLAVVPPNELDEAKHILAAETSAAPVQAQGKDKSSSP